MDIEELNKQQVILLATLVSFVTSIATGIVTVSLLEETPVSMNRSVNRVVERTVERVVPDKDTKDTTDTKVIEKEKTVVVKEEDQITQAIQQGADSLVRIYNGEPSQESAAFLGLGVVVRSDGLVATDSSTAIRGSSLYGVVASGTSYPLTVAREGRNVTMLQATSSEQTSEISLTPLKLADISNLQLGKTVIAVGGRERNSVSMGIISEIIPEESTTNATSSQMSGSNVAEIRTNIDRVGLTSGTPLLNIFGEAVALTVKRGGELRFITANHISRQISSLSAGTSTNTGS